MNTLTTDRSWWLALLVLLAAVQTQLHAQATQSNDSAEWVGLYEPYADEEMPYRLMRPHGFDPGKLYPVIVSLHGGGGRGADNRRQLRVWNRLLAEDRWRTGYPSYVLAPQSTRLWDATHLKKIKAVVAELPSVDMDRIYILGHSMGGHGTFILLQIDPLLFRSGGAVGRDRQDG